ncbi:hypothetical protein SEA_WOFFORD_279 [Streptomyces phage Wofford]|uniref:Uncharacterized protein n=1 Tax=Streptomyces phage Wofford TaxID=2283267 RepID=A0A345M9P8_9CAUD|nr:hypothetical protein HWB78_gp021 [Streptomyces phage Wollford]YP_009839922.1 hypothetical protein HWB78_gp040 [Streptomyces phage Wollford]AXH67219.1 hypothetical protein SEA_WOFFORD_21 [Streptomyces phage Wollford]AXH67413.1 hypothetical protein SEA_WOFFORD_279 [Streptomyces phage Wollford]
MPQVSLNQFILDTIWAYQNDNDEQRYGQFCFNRVARVRPDIAQTLTGTPCDPFYANDNNDPRIHRFWAKVQELWDQ